MTDTTLKEAIKEAYASAPDDEIIVYTIEMRHPAFTQPLRVVRDHKSFTGTLEASASANAGEAVEFLPYAFDLELPEIAETGKPEIVLTIDNVSREIVASIEAAVRTPYKIEITFRIYLMSDTAGPQNDPPMSMVINTIEADVFKVTARAGFADLSKTAFPRKTYTLDQFPSLSS